MLFCSPDCRISIYIYVDFSSFGKGYSFFISFIEQAGNRFYTRYNIRDKIIWHKRNCMGTTYSGFSLGYFSFFNVYLYLQKNEKAGISKLKKDDIKEMDKSHNDNISIKKEHAFNETN